MAASPLMVVTLVVRPRPAVAALDHVLRAISSYLDNSGLIPLDHASAFGPIRLLDRIWENSNPETQGERRRWSLCKHLRSDAHYYRYQFMKSLRAAVTRGDLGVVRWIMEHFSGCKAGVEVVEDAARHGRLEILQYLLEYERQGGGEDETRNTIWWGTDDLVKALEGGFPEVARWLYENTPEADRDLSRAMEFAVRRGDLSVIRWLLDVVYRPDLNLLPPALNDAAAGGHMELLQWIFEQGYEGRSDRALEGAAKNGRADMVEWLMRSSKRVDPKEHAEASGIITDPSKYEEMQAATWSKAATAG
ncbi:uncharacterized protein IUM83_03884 [Phytophthora cinnamomi]|uniref:uncharacterized protein n=1 Tax=Phytophthora cinnamomi TaxID=4785 RepID=UPI003559F4D0|nr:hypothetical protein IUM83_03884 [Phytophthora cinnamomi]